MSHKEVFTQIYRNRIWGDGSEKNPLSGGGSNPNLTAPYVEFIQRIIDSHNIKTVLDIGHGDWTMWRDYKFENVTYTGIDVAQNISSELNSKFGNKTRKFLEFESNDYHYPIADLIISKEVFQHLPNADLANFLNAASEFEYLVFCNGYYPRNLLFFRLRNLLKFRTRLAFIRKKKSPFFKEKFPRNNMDIPAGAFRGIDLEMPDFSKLLVNHEMIHKFDFGGPRNFGVVNRVYFLKKKSSGST
jgi:hypothetical protein